MRPLVLVWGSLHLEDRSVGHARLLKCSQQVVTFWGLSIGSGSGIKSLCCLPGLCVSKAKAVCETHESQQDGEQASHR